MDSAQQLGEVLARLAPRGRATNFRTGGVARSTLDGLAGRPAEAERRAGDLLREVDPRTTFELLPEFERAYGLPTGCVPDPQTIVERRAAVIDRMTALRGATPADLAALAERVSTGAEVVEYHAFVAGSPAGGLLSNGDWLHTFTLRTVQEPFAFFRVGENGAGDALVQLTRPTLECLVRDAAPAHTIATFDYTLPPDPAYQPWDELRFRPTTALAIATVPRPDFEG